MKFKNSFFIVITLFIFHSFLLAMQPPLENKITDLNSVLSDLSSELTGIKVTPTKKIGNLVRSEFFKDIVGYSEDEFRSKQKWEWIPKVDLLPPGNPWNQLNGILNKWNETRKQGWIQAQPRRAAIFQGTFECPSIGDLDQKLQNYKPTTKPRFIVRIYDPSTENEKFSDIRYLQAQPENKFANFQLASTFWGPLEGGMVLFDSKLEDMLAHAVQGENASIGCAGATIWRKYFMPTNYISKGISKGYWYLLDYLNVAWSIFRKFPSINYNRLPDYATIMNNKAYMLIGIQKDIVVTSGYGPFDMNKGRPQQNDVQEKLDVIVKSDGSVDTNKTQIVTQLFTSAYNMGKVRRTPQTENFAKAILNVAYESTFKAAAYNAMQDQTNKNRSKLYLTMLGGGAFKNDIDWIKESIKRSISTDVTTGSLNLINQYGLDVILIYRPDPRRTDINREANFMNDMITLIFMIHGKITKKDQDDIVNVFKEYLQKFNGKDFNGASAIAQRINTYFEQVAQ